MHSGVRYGRARATTISVCSGKGGVGKSTLSLLLAARLAAAGKRTLLLDAVLGIGDIVTMTNLAPTVGLEDLLGGRVELGDALVSVTPHLAVIGTVPGSYFGDASITKQGLENCKEINDRFDSVVIDTPSTLDPFVVHLIGSSDLAITVTTSHIPAIADSYIQLKRVIQAALQAKHGFVVNRVGSQVEGDQTVVKFGELGEKFLRRSIPALGILENDVRLEHAAENQSLLAFAAEPGSSVKRVDRMVKVLIENYIERKAAGVSLWDALNETIPLRNASAFDDREPVVYSPTDT